MTTKIILLFVLFILITLTQMSLMVEVNKTTVRILSRRKRYLIFPEGSSLQLVFCLTMPSIGMGNVFTVGSTVALAWELPHDPLQPYRKPSELLHRKDVIDKNNPIEWIPDNSTLSINSLGNSSSAGSGYSTVNNLFENSFDRFTLKNDEMHRSRSGNKQYNRNELESHPIHHQVYRRTRRDLYPKIEKLFTALKRDGKACLLKSICEVNKLSRKRGTFSQEMFKVLFRVKQYDNYQDEDEYDYAANNQHNCTEMYPNCPDNNMMIFFK